MLTFPVLFIWLVCDYLVWRVYLCSTRVIVIMWWQAATSRPLSAILFFEGPHLQLDNTAFHFSDFRLSLHPVLHRELAILPIMHLRDGVSGGIMSRPRKRTWFLQPSEISELTVDTEYWWSKSIKQCKFIWGRSQSSRGRFWKCARGCHNLNHTAKQPVVTSPAIFVQCL